MKLINYILNHICFKKSSKLTFYAMLQTLHFGNLPSLSDEYPWYSGQIVAQRTFIYICK